jgi:ubiquinone biosynthesis protein COQ4
MRWRRAWRSLRALLADPDDTGKAMDLFHAIGAGDLERQFRRFLESPMGERLLARGDALTQALSDRGALARMPADSLGRAYLAYLDANGFEPEALLALRHEVQARWAQEEGEAPLGAARERFQDRSTLCHDLGHVVTGYGTDDVGEATLLAFFQGQHGGLANGLLTLAAAFECWRHLGAGWLRYDFAAWRRGRRARLLFELPFEDLLPLPLDTVRCLAGVVPAERAHPGGILRRQLREPRTAGAGTASPRGAAG